jgi:N-acetylglucosaminyl-diphospho-decaprenol L-rhamnosyltransferase
MDSRLSTSGVAEGLAAPPSDVCVVVVSDGDDDKLGLALASVLRHAGWLDLEAIVVEDGEDGATARFIEESFIDVRTIRSASRGLGHAYNRALNEANARYVLFVGPEIAEVCEGDLATLVSALDRRPEIGLAGVRQLSGDGALLPTIRRFPSARHMLAEALGIDRLPGARRILGESELDRRKYGQATACDWTSGLVLVRHAALEKAGWFDERFRHSVGEADLCLRLRRAGWQVVHMPLLTARRRRGNRWANARAEAQAAYARMQFARKHFPRAAADYRWALALRYAVRVGLYSFQRPRRHGGGRRQAARAALATVLSGRVPLEDGPAL